MPVLDLFKRKRSATAPASTVSSTVMLRGGRTVQVVGEASYQDALDRIAGGKSRQGTLKRCTAALVPEPSNRHDKNAICIHIDGQAVGYLGRDDAKAYQPVVQKLARRATVGTCSALIKGGWRGSSGDEGNYGVELDLAPPDAVLK